MLTLNLIIEVKLVYVPSKNPNFPMEEKLNPMEEKCQDMSSHQRIFMREIDHLVRVQVIIPVIQIILW